MCLSKLKKEIGSGASCHSLVDNAGFDRDGAARLSIPRGEDRSFKLAICLKKKRHTVVLSLLCPMFL